MSPITVFSLPGKNEYVASVNTIMDHLPAEILAAIPQTYRCRATQVALTADYHHVRGYDFSLDGRSIGYPEYANIATTIFGYTNSVNYIQLRCWKDQCEFLVNWKENCFMVKYRSIISVLYSGLYSPIANLLVGREIYHVGDP